MSSIKKQYQHPRYQKYGLLESLLLIAVKKEDSSSEYQIVTEFYNKNFDTRWLKLYLEIISADFTQS